MNVFRKLFSFPEKFWHKEQKPRLATVTPIASKPGPKCKEYAFFRYDSSWSPSIVEPYYACIECNLHWNEAQYMNWINKEQRKEKLLKITKL